MEGDPVYRLDEQVGYLLRRVNQRHLAVFAGVIPEVTTTQLAAIAKLAELGPLSQNQLGRATAMDAATIKGVVGRLVQRRLVTTVAEPGGPASADRRPHPRGPRALRPPLAARARGLAPHPRPADPCRPGPADRPPAQAGLTRGRAPPAVH